MQEKPNDKLQTCIALARAVFLPPAVLLQPGKTTFHNPAFGHDLESA